MSITKELRELAAAPLLVYASQEVYAEALIAIANRIDAEHEETIQQVLIDEGGVPVTDENMAEHGWVSLPKDADGKYIRIGDVLTDDAEFKSEGKVMRLMLEGEGWMVGLGCSGWTVPSVHEWHHCHVPTVEDVLRDFAYCCEEGATEQSVNEIIAEYAPKLRLADDGKEQ